MAQAALRLAALPSSLLRLSLRTCSSGPRTGSLAATSQADTFGTIKLGLEDKALFHDYDFLPEDRDAQDEHEAKVADIYRPGREAYLRKINRLVHQKNDLRAALLVLPEMKEQCVKPEQAHFRILIHACSKVGHTAKAFELYRELTNRGLPRHVGIFSDLFQSCALGPDPAIGLEKATYLRKKLAGDRFTPNKILYHTMIKAFGRCGDLETAFELVDEMTAAGHQATSDTMGHLLQGCISDRASGFRAAVLVWRRMRRRQIWPTLPCYRLMLRAALQAGLGSAAHSGDLLEACRPVDARGRPVQPRLAPASIAPPHQPGPEGGLELVTGAERERALGPAARELPNLLAKRPDLEGVVALDPEDTKENRLLLLGGHKGFLQQMARDRVQPDCRTIAQLLALAPNTNQVEAELLALLPELEIKPDVSLYNQVIRARARRKEYELGRAALGDLHLHGLTPDVQTFGVLALCCRDWAACRTFLHDLDALGARLNLEMLCALVGSLAVVPDPRGVQRLLERGEGEGLRPDGRMVERVERFYQWYRGQV